MNTITKAILAGGAVVALAGAAYAQGAAAQSPSTRATLADPEGKPPDPGHIPFVLPKDIKWTGDPKRQETAVVYGERATYPFHAGTFSTDVANTVHWDGARSGEKEPAVILLTGIGPVKTVQVDETGKPLPPRAPAAK